MYHSDSQQVGYRKHRRGHLVQLCEIIHSVCAAVVFVAVTVYKLLAERYTRFFKSHLVSVLAGGRRYSLGFCSQKSDIPVTLFDKCGHSIKSAAFIINSHRQHISPRHTLTAQCDIVILCKAVQGIRIVHRTQQYHAIDSPVEKHIHLPCLSSCSIIRKRRDYVITEL